MDGFVTGKVVKTEKNVMIVQFEGDFNVHEYLLDSKCELVRVHFVDKHPIKDEQRKRIFAMIGDIADASGHDKYYLRSVMTLEFCFYEEVAPFSLATVDEQTANRFIRYLVEFCIGHDIPSKNPLYSRCDDIRHTAYCSLFYKRCAVCGRESEFHHCTGSRAGMGRKSVEIPLVGLLGMALCREHHTEIHSDAEQVFCKLYHVTPCLVDKRIAEKYPHYSDVGEG